MTTKQILIVHIYADPDEHGIETAPKVEPKFLCGGEDEEHSHNNMAEALDLQHGKIYWGESVGDQPGRIRRANMDCSDIEELTTVGWNTFGLALDVEGLFYSEWLLWSRDQPDFRLVSIETSDLCS